MRFTIIILSLLLSIVSIHAQDVEVNIQLEQGWNWISINIIPNENMFIDDRDGPDVPRMFAQAVDPEGEPLLNIVRNVQGRFFAPAMGFNNIPYWNLQQGVMVLANEEVNVIWEGEQINADANIQIDRGWNLLAYYPTYELNANNVNFAVIADIIADVQIVFDDRGRFILPAFDFSNMNPWQQGKGYFVLYEPINDEVDQIDFSYPAQRDEEMIRFDPGVHWELPIVSDFPMALLVNDIQGPDGFEPAEGDQIVAFTEMFELTGVGSVHDGRCGVAIWGGGNFMGVDFVEDGAEFTLMYYDEDQDAEYQINIEEVLEGEGLTFESLSFSVIEISVVADEIIPELEVPLTEGWNMISINVEPLEEMWENEQGPDIILMTEQLRIDDDNHHIILMKNNEGLFYSPGFDFNGIDFWDLQQGYQINVDEDVVAVWSGRRIAPDADIRLQENWNMIAYYPTYALDASDPDFYVLSPIIDHVELAKDGNGRFMNPEFEFSDMPPWRETQGYKVKVDEDVVLNYPDELEEEDNYTSPSLKDLSPHPTLTGSNMSLLILDLQSKVGSVLKAFDSNNVIVGQSIVNLEAKCGLAIWGDDPTTTEKDGLADGEAFSLMIDGSNIMPTIYHAGKSLNYEVDNFIVIEVTIDATIPSEYYFSDAYPNPFNDRTVISYGLPESGLVGINLFDISGRLVKSLGKFEKTAGFHSFELNASDLSSGLFLLRIDVNGIYSVNKIVLMK